MLIGKNNFKEISKRFLETGNIPKAVSLRGSRGIGKTYCCDWLATQTKIEYTTVEEQSLPVLAQYTGVQELGMRTFLQVPHIENWQKKNQYYLSQLLDGAPSNMHMFLTYDESKKVPQALLSRSLDIHIPPAKSQDVIVFLTQNLQYEGNEAYRLARLCQGNIGRLIEIVQTDREEKIKFWNTFLKALFDTNYSAHNFEFIFRENPEDAIYNFLRIWKTLITQESRDVYLLYDVYAYTKKVRLLFEETQDYNIINLFLENLHTITHSNQPLDRKKILNGI